MYEELIYRRHLYAFIEIPSGILDQDVPDAFPFNRVTVNGVRRKKTFREYLLYSKESLDGTKALVLLAVRTSRKYGRRTPISIQELRMWNRLLLSRNYGYASGKWFGMVGYKLKIASPEYSDAT